MVTSTATAITMTNGNVIICRQSNHFQVLQFEFIYLFIWLSARRRLILHFQGILFVSQQVGKSAVLLNRFVKKRMLDSMHTVTLYTVPAFSKIKTQLLIFNQPPQFYNMLVSGFLKNSEDNNDINRRKAHMYYIVQIILRS